MTVAVMKSLAETNEIQLVKLAWSTKVLWHIRIKQSSGVKIKSPVYWIRADMSTVT